MRQGVMRTVRAHFGAYAPGTGDDRNLPGTSPAIFAWVVATLLSITQSRDYGMGNPGPGPKRQTLCNCPKDDLRWAISCPRKQCNFLHSLRSVYLPGLTPVLQSLPLNEGAQFVRLN